MKWLFALLLIANFAFWGYTRLEVPPKPLDWKSREINAASLSVVALEQPKPLQTQDALPPATDKPTDAAKPSDKSDDKPAKDAKTGSAQAVAADKPNETKPAETKAADAKVTETKPIETKKGPLVCFAWKGILDEDLPNVRKKLASLNLGGEIKTQTAENDSKAKFWVYIPPRGTNADAQKKADEIKAMGVTDFFVVNDGGKFQNAISLGLFSSKDAAERRLEAVKDLGVHSAIMHARSEGVVGATLLLKHIPKDAKSALNSAASGFRGSSVSETDCS